MKLFQNDTLRIMRTTLLWIDSFRKKLEEINYWFRKKKFHLKEKRTALDGDFTCVSEPLPVKLSIIH